MNGKMSALKLLSTTLLQSVPVGTPKKENMTNILATCLPRTLLIYLWSIV